MCGNCYGFGFQSKRKEIANYSLDLKYTNYPNYNSKQELLKIFLETAVDYREFMSRLHQNKTKNKGRKAA